MLICGTFIYIQQNIVLFLYSSIAIHTTASTTHIPKAWLAIDLDSILGVQNTALHSLFSLFLRPSSPNVVFIHHVLSTEKSTNLNFNLEAQMSSPLNIHNSKPVPSTSIICSIGSSINQQVATSSESRPHASKEAIQHWQLTEGSRCHLHHQRSYKSESTSSIGMKASQLTQLYHPVFIAARLPAF